MELMVAELVTTFGASMSPSHRIKIFFNIDSMKLYLNISHKPSQLSPPRAIVQGVLGDQESDSCRMTFIGDP